MGRVGKRRWAIFVHDPDGDMGYGEIVGPFTSAERADAKAQAIRRADESVECVVVPIAPGAVGAREVARRVH